MNWMNHIEEITYRLSGAFYVIRLTVHISNINNEINLLNIILFYYNIGNNFEGGGGNSSNSGKFFTLQKKIVRIMDGAQPRTSCISLFKELYILLLPFQYILSLMRFAINNQSIFRTNSSIHNINTRYKHHLTDQMPTYLFLKKKNTFLYQDQNFRQFTT